MGCSCSIKVGDFEGKGDSYLQDDCHLTGKNLGSKDHTLKKERNMSGLQQFEKQQYLNIETFRQNGQGVKTPVWFAQEGEKLFIWTETSSGKAKLVDECEAALEHLKGLMSRKYGFVFSIFGLIGKLRGAKYTSIQVEVKSEE
jgi:hypothetical protein